MTALWHKLGWSEKKVCAKSIKIMTTKGMTPGYEHL